MTLICQKRPSMFRCRQPTNNKTCVGHAFQCASLRMVAFEWPFEWMRALSSGARISNFEIGNSKYEIRNPKFEIRNSNIAQCSALASGPSGRQTAQSTPTGPTRLASPTGSARRELDRMPVDRLARFSAGQCNCSNKTNPIKLRLIDGRTAALGCS